MPDPRVRRSELAKIHLARVSLAMTEDSYRALLRRVTGYGSAGELDAAGRRAVIAEFHRLGWRPGRSKTRPRPSADPQVRMCRALWIELAELGAVRDPSDRALNNLARRVTGIGHLEWCDARQLNSVIEALKGWRDRVQGERQERQS